MGSINYTPPGVGAAGIPVDSPSADDQLFASTGVGVAAWTSVLDILVVDDITIDNAELTSSTDLINFDCKAGIKVVGTQNERLNIGGNLGFDTVSEITTNQKNAMDAGLSEDTGGTLSAGEYHYDIRFDTYEGSSKPIYMVFGAAQMPDITVSANAKVVMTSLPTSPNSRVVSRTIYRVPNPGDAELLAAPIYTIADNTTTTWTDDGSLTPSGTIVYNQGNSTAGGITIENDHYFFVDEHSTHLGYEALKLNTSYDNVAIGSGSGDVSTTGSDLSLLGHNSGGALTTGNTNTFIGVSAGLNITTGKDNTLIGGYTFGTSAGAATNYQTFIGKEAGYGAMRAATDHGNTGVGYQAASNLGGAYNVLMGFGAGKQASAQVDNDYNVIIGALAAQNLTGGSYNIIIGYDIDPDSGSGDYQLNIGNLIKGDAFNKTVELDAALTLLERPDPAEPSEGECVMWMSNGTSSQTGVADGDVVIASKVGGATKVTILHDHSAAGAWV